MYSFSNKIIIRTPLLPLRLDLIREGEILHFFNNQSINEAIYLASPALHSELEKLNNASDNTSKKKLILSFCKYYLRMQSRCTPYGLFAGCSIAEWGNESKIVFPKIESTNINRHTRPDMNFLCAHAQTLSQNESIKPFLKFFPNNSIYKLANKLRYVEYYYNKTKRIHQIVSIDDSDYLNKILQKSSNGAYISDLIKVLTTLDVDHNDALEFIHELIANQILISELEPSVTGPEFTIQLISKLKRIYNETKSKEIEDEVCYLNNLFQNLNLLDKHSFNNTSEYKKIYHSLKTNNQNLEENYLFQVDLYKKTITAKLNDSIQKDLTQAVEFLTKINYYTERPNLKKFKSTFLERYETQEIPLLEALDPETGIGYLSKDTAGLSELLDGLYISPRLQSENSAKFTPFQNILLHKYLKAYKNEDHIITLTDEDLKNLKIEEGILPPSLSIAFKVLNNDKIFIQNCGNSSAVNILGRFTHGSDEIRFIVDEIVSFEKKKNPNKIIAEVVHLPEDRIGNVLLRQSFHEYEIPYLTSSSLNPEFQILLSDLFISVKDEKVILRSKKLDKEIMPRLSTAHNFNNNALPVYQFLGDLQFQDFNKIGLAIDWGPINSFGPFLPRIEYKNLILMEASWNLKKNDFAVLVKKGTLTKEEIYNWRLQYKLPDIVLFSEGDNELLIDFNNELGIEVFQDLIKKRESIMLTEFLFSNGSAITQGETGENYVNECIAILYNNNYPIASNKNQSIQSQTQLQPEIQRQFTIGDDWLYYKIYCGIKSADTLLTDTINPLLYSLSSKGLINSYFFLRYSDPNWHLRLRLSLTNKNNLGEVVLLIHKYLSPQLSTNVISRIQTDTYVREIERYGSCNIEFIEELFYIHSDATINFLRFYDDEKLKWQFTIKLIDDFLNIFNYSLTEKKEILEALKINYINEHSDSKELKVQLDAKFRHHKKEINNIFTSEYLETVDLLSLKEILLTTLEKTIPLAKQIIRNYELGSSDKTLEEILSSCIHMILNRIFYARQRTYEMVIYDLLYKYYKSSIAINKNNKVLIK